MQNDTLAKQYETIFSEGIEGRSDDDAVLRTIQLADAASELKNKDGVARAMQWFAALEKRPVSERLLVLIDYGRASAIATDRYGTAWKWEQPTLARELFYLRRAVSRPAFSKSANMLQCMILNNLGNRLAVAGRIIDAIESWRRTLAIVPMFGMALCNLAHHLVIYALGFEGQGTRAVLLRTAGDYASAALSSNAVYTDVRDEQTRERARRDQEWIESIIKQPGIVQPRYELEAPANVEERQYRHWCASNRMYLDPANDVNTDLTDLQDWFGLPGHAVPVDTPDLFDSFFDQLKQEYVSARWTLYQGLQRKGAHFSDARVRLYVTRPRATLSLSIEQVKSAYRTAYSLFDKISVFLNAYMELNISESDVTFRRVWQPKAQQPLRRQFDQSENWGFCALYWSAADFFENTEEDVAEPQAKDLTRIRNFLEHKYLKVTPKPAQHNASESLAYIVERDQFEAKALHLLQRARAALIYLAIGVHTEEIRRTAVRGDAVIETLPGPEEIPDSEKI